MKIRGKCMPSRGSSKCKDPEVERSWAHLRNNKMAEMTARTVAGIGPGLLSEAAVGVR